MSEASQDRAGGLALPLPSVAHLTSLTPARKAALRVAEELVKAKQGAYYRHGWASYLHRSDVEVLLLSCLNETEKAVYLKAVSEARS